MKKFNLMGPGSRSDITPFSSKEFWRYYTKNSGNMIFYYACEKILNLDKLKYGWGGDKESINSTSNGIMIPMANQLGDHFDLKLSGPKISQISKPIIAIGLGAQIEFSEESFSTIPKGSTEWLKGLASKTKTKNIAVRGTNTKKFLDRVGIGGSVVETGCPSLLINPNIRLGNTIKAKFKAHLKEGSLFEGLTVTAGDPHHKNLALAGLEKSFIDFIERYRGTYIVQNPEILIKLTSGWYESLSELEYNLLRKRWFDELSNKEIESWFRVNALTFFSVPSWIYYMGNRSLVIGTRIHGVQAALQSGTPAICFYIDARTKELCETMKIPCAPAERYYSSLTEQDCISILEEWDENEFDRNRKVIAGRFKNFFEDNGIEYSDELLHL